MASFAIGTVVATTAQDVSPALLGVKPPFVAAAVLFAASRLHLPVALAVAVAAGLFLDALAGLPAFCATSLLPLLVLGSYFTRGCLPDISNVTTGAGATVVASAIGEVWLSICGFSAAGTGLFVRVCAATVVAVPVGVAVFALLPLAGRCIGLEDPG